MTNHTSSIDFLRHEYVSPCAPPPLTSHSYTIAGKKPLKRRGECVVEESDVTVRKNQERNQLLVAEIEKMVSVCRCTLFVLTRPHNPIRYGNRLTVDVGNGFPIA